MKIRAHSVHRHTAATEYKLEDVKPRRGGGLSFKLSPKDVFAGRRKTMIPGLVVWVEPEEVATLLASGMGQKQARCGSCAGCMNSEACSFPLKVVEQQHYPGKPRPGADPMLPAPPDDASVVKVSDLREGHGTVRPRVRVLSIDEEGGAKCVLVRSGNQKTIRVATLSKAYRLIERNYAPQGDSR